MHVLQHCFISGQDELDNGPGHRLDYHIISSHSLNTLGHSEL